MFIQYLLLWTFVKILFNLLLDTSWYLKTKLSGYLKIKILVNLVFYNFICMRKNNALKFMRILIPGICQSEIKDKYLKIWIRKVLQSFLFLNQSN